MKNKALNTIYEYMVMVLGCLLFAIAWESFVIPNNMSSGGLMGICTVVQYATSGALNASVLYLIANIFLLLLSFAFMGVTFGIRTIFCIILTSLFMPLVDKLSFLRSVPGNFLALPDPILVPVMAGLVEGLSLGLVFRHNGSTGGSDIIALFLNRYWPISPGRFYIIFDSVIITSILLLPGKSFGDMVYGYIMMAVSALVLDWVTLGAKSSVQLLVFSKEYEKIADHITHDLDRGVTVLKSIGWYTKEEKNVLLILVRKKQLFDITKHIKAVDQNAFLSVSDASGVFGEGFEEIKVGYKKKKK